MSQLRSLKESIKRYKLHSLFVKNFIIILLVVMIPFDIISLFFYTSSNRSVRQEVYQSNYNLNCTVRGITDALMKEFLTLAINTSLQDEVMRYFLNEPKPGGTSELQASLITYCKNFTYVKPSLHSIYIYCDSTDTVLAQDSAQAFSAFSDKGWYDEYLSLKRGETKVVLRAHNDYYPYLLTMIAPVYSTNVDRMGAVVINVDVQELAKIFRYLDSPSAQKIYITDSEGRVIYSETQDEILRNISESALPDAFLSVMDSGETGYHQDGVSYVFSALDSQFFGWRYYCIVPMDLDAGRSKMIITYFLLLLVVSLLIGALGSFFISTKTFRPIGSILELISQPKGELDNLYAAKDELDSLYAEPQNESTYILSRISNTLAANEQLKEELNAKLMLLKHAQIVALQSQINPHFLFNTLDTINWMAIDAFEGENDISDALTSLGSLFQLNIDTANYLTDLRSELDYTKQYIEILKLRYKDVFRTVWDVDEALQNCKVPRLILQPLVENALYHGIKPKRAPGEIRLRAAADGEQLLLVIADDGVGMDGARLKKLTAELEQDYAFGSNHVGLKNINQRVKLIYGNEYGIQIESDASGTTVRLRFPRVE